MSAPDVRVTALDTAKKQFRTVNITATKTSQVKTYNQVTVDSRLHETVMDSGATVKGLKTLHISGYNIEVLAAETLAWVSGVVANGGTVSDSRRSLINTLISGLIADGVWVKLDRLWVFRNENNISARTDLVGLELAGVVGSPTFTANQGYAGTDTRAIATDYLTTSTLMGAYSKYTQNSAHISVWDMTNLATAVDTGGGCLLGVADGVVPETSIFDTWADDANVYLRINDSPQSLAQGVPSTRIGHFIVNRTGAALSEGYYNGALTYPNINATSAAIVGHALTILAQNVAGTVSYGTPNQVAIVTVGAGLTATEAGKLFTRLQAYVAA